MTESSPRPPSKFRSAYEPGASSTLPEIVTATSSMMPETKIRGKRKRREPARSDVGGDSPAVQRLKPASELRSSRHIEFHVRQQQHHQIPKSKDTTSLSHLERLPNELIQHIFFSSLELNLSNTSRTLREVMSTDTIRQALILFAFFDDDGENPVETKHFLPTEYRRLDIEEKLRLQKGVLDSDWCSLAKIQASMQTLCRLKMVQAWHADQKVYKSLTKDGPIPIKSAARCLTHLTPIPRLEDERRLEQYFCATSDTSTDATYVPTIHVKRVPERPVPCCYRPAILTCSLTNNEFDPRAPPPPYINPELFSAKPMIRMSFNKFSSILCVRYIPNSLLSGSPWTKNKIEMLQFLRQGHRFILQDFVLSLSYESLFKGMASAIEEHNILALKVLLELHYAVSCRPLGLTTATSRPIDLWEQQYRVFSARPIPLELFHLAAQLPRAESTCVARTHRRTVNRNARSRNFEDPSSESISLLLRAGLNSVPRDDPILTSWALEAQQRGDETAKWLLDHMDSQYCTQSGNEHFNNGSIHWQYHARFDLPGARQSFTEELEYLAQLPRFSPETTFIPHNPQE